jgi:isoleucyl-tRNA synthetase
MFKKVNNRANFPELETEILQFWKDNHVFEKSGQDDGRPLFMLFEGPPTANGSPGIHHVLARVFKDIICRYKTMQGFRPIRKGGWDTHGLPVELEIEKELGLRTKRDIENYGIERFNQKCRESVFRYVKEWEDLTDRIAYWVDMKDPYVTLTNDYIETGWWIIKNLWDKDLIYKGVKATPHCPRCVTSLSSHEVALGYQENTRDPSVFVKFAVKDDTPQAKGLLGKLPAEAVSNTYFLAWTTTPWTLPGNTALALNLEAEYSVVRVESEEQTFWLVMASALVAKVVKVPHEVVASVKGGELIGASYHKLYDPVQYGVEVKDTRSLQVVAEYTPKLIGGEFVSLEDGSGIVHIAPAFGEEDLDAGRSEGLAFVQPVDLQGQFVGSYPWAGKFVKQTDEMIMKDLVQRGLLFKRETYLHTYPFCWRCKTPLLYYAKESWYIRMTAVKDNLIRNNQQINWYPEYIKEGRFGEWLRGLVDWAISRERYWGTPIPFWQCGQCGHYHCIGSLAELKAMATASHKARVDGLDMHRPYVDEIEVQCPKCQGVMKRVPEVMDAWFDSGAMPYAQWHVMSDEHFQRILSEGRFPADYISEAVDQTRGWFYSLLALSTLLADEPSYKNVICLGLILDEKGRKMSKSQGNVVNPWEVINTQGADAVRWYLYTATQPGDSRRFSQRLVNEVVRQFILTLWNVYSFFVTYAEIDKFDPSKVKKGWKPTAELDRWILSELNVLVQQVTNNLESYDPTNGGRRIQEFVDILSTWYVRRSRRRFWKSENDQDKTSAYTTLYTCLTTLSKLLAPYTPYLAESIYQNLVRTGDGEAPESVHLSRYPKQDASMIDQPLMDATRLAMRICSLGRDARSRSGKKVRLPLAKAVVVPRDPAEAAYLEQIREQVLDELNVKELSLMPKSHPLYEKASTSIAGETRAALINGWQFVADAGYLVGMDTNVTPELIEEGLARELVHRIQNLRKSAGFEVTDRIVTYYRGPDEVRRVMERFGDYVKLETLSDGLREGEVQDGGHVEEQTVDGLKLTLGVKRIS